MVEPQREAMSLAARNGATKQRRDRRPRLSWWHEQPPIAMVVASSLRHSRGKTHRTKCDASRCQKAVNATQEQVQQRTVEHFVEVSTPQVLERAAEHSFSSINVSWSNLWNSQSRRTRRKMRRRRSGSLGSASMNDS